MATEETRDEQRVSTRLRAVCIRLSQREHEILSEAASFEGVKLAEYVRVSAKLAAKALQPVLQPKQP